MSNTISEKFLFDVKSILGTARMQAVKSVEFHRVQMYWKLGERIFVEEQQGKDRAEYGAYLIKTLAAAIEPEYGSGFTVRQLERCRQFYRVFPIASALRTQLNWMQYKLLISIADLHIPVKPATHSGSKFTTFKTFSEFKTLISRVAGLGWNMQWPLTMSSPTCIKKGIIYTYPY
jgi:hypothetical protein